LNQFKALKKDKLVKSTASENGLLNLYKYSQNVFYKNLWDKGGYPLLKARGIVLDIAGNIVQHPFDKIFNYHENGAGEDIHEKEVVQYVQKLNGFLGNIGFDPYTKKLLVTTTGSFSSDFVGYIKDFIDRNLEIKLLKYLSKNRVTLSFEVIHPKDPHIVKYPEDMFGLHLIGVRGLGKKDKSWQEKDIDLLAEEFGFKRAYHDFATFGEVKEKIKTLKDEGFMIRRKVGQDYDFEIKMKSPYYLTAKFVGRMGEGNVKFMFSNPEKFKEKIGDEEFYPLVDLLVSRVSREEFLSMDQNERVSFVRGIVEEIL
jgi:tRNA splicing ligase